MNTAIGTVRIPTQRTGNGACDTPTLRLPVIGQPNLGQPKVDDRTGRGTLYGRLRDHAVKVIDQQQPTVDVAGELADAVTLAHTGLLIDTETARIANRLTARLNRADTDPAETLRLRQMLHGLAQMPQQGPMSEQVLTLAEHPGMTAAGRLAAIHDVFAAHQATACPGWCNDHYPDEQPGDTSHRFHRGVVGTVEGRAPEDGTRTGFEVAVERIDRDGRAGVAYVTIAQTRGADLVLGGPGAVSRLVRLLLAARRMVKADRRSGGVR